MRPDRWRELSAWLDRVLEVEVAERESWLEREIEDPELRAEVAELAALAEREPGVVDGSAAERLATLLSERGLVDRGVRESAQERVGPYEIVEEIGRGGMGVVYLAERADGQFENRVALKLIRPGLDSGEVVRRFEHERRVLAQLEHPNIARIFDGGVTEDGRLYFAMEYVDGEPITSHCDRHRLRIEDRLRLFTRVCDAVQYAHGRLVVHRDLKPSNVLVAENGDIKLVDFGIAKLLTDESAELTRVGGNQPVTPAYAAPEQIEERPVTTATDIHALGVLLCELLSGRRPFEVGSGSRHELADAILTSDPMTPSRCVSEEEGEAASLRRESVTGLRRRLSGDLDAIAGTALRKIPEERYASAQAMREDIEAHLAHRPIRARSEGALVRSGKFVRRHRVGVAATLLVIGALAAGLAGTTLQSRARALEARKAEEVKDFVLELFEASDPSVARGEDVTARALLDRGAERIESELAGQPEVQAQLLGTVGLLYVRLGLDDEAEPLLKRSLEQTEDLYGSNSLEAAAARDRWAVLLWSRGDYAESETAHRQVLAVRERLLGSDHSLVAETLTHLANAVTGSGDYEESEKLHRRALAIERAEHGVEAERTADSMANLAAVLRVQGNYDEAEPLYRKALAIQERVLGVDHPSLAGTALGLASLLSTRGDFDEAEEFFRRSIDLREKIFGPENPQLAFPLENYSMHLQRRGDLAAARPISERALSIRRQTLAPDNPDLATSLNNYGVLCYRLSDFEQAEEYMREALEIWVQKLGREHPSVASSLNNIGVIRLELGDPAGAEPLVREGLEIRRRLAGGEANQAVAQSVRNLGLVQIELGEITEAEKTLTSGLELARGVYPERHIRTAEMLIALGLLRLDQGRIVDAEPLLREAYTIRNEQMNPDDWRVAEAEFFYRASLEATQPGTEDRERMRVSLGALREAKGGDHWLIRRAEAVLQVQ